MDSRIFLDASFWIAYRDARQAKFLRAQELVPMFFKNRAKFVTTLPVFCEIHAHFVRHAGRRITILNDFWQNPLVHFEPIMPVDTQNALELLTQQHDKKYSFCDTISFMVMRRLGLRQAASFDDHFRQIGEFDIIC